MYPFIDAGRAYHAQQLFVEDHLNGGDQVIGAKLGMTSRVKRAMLGVDQPVSGWLTAGMVLSHGQPVAFGQLIHPQAEPEIAIVLGEEPAHPATVASVFRPPRRCSRRLRSLTPVLKTSGRVTGPGRFRSSGPPCPSEAATSANRAH
jgi:hypothetical protein